MWLCKADNKLPQNFSMLTRLILSMAAVASSAADECFAPAGQLAGRLVVVTGASRGVGAELARTFASEGANAVTGQSMSVDGGLTMP